ncbi:metal-dependent hydrolase [Pseudozobellia thermophila]|uniref:Inner membrane protein n=1 Tax=Pseudozobellia thermophila TaxID=192903 RepID=A0A1M6N001_9FLAO|nr:metal-dependent hydrolase [Pseudozobellia thermophila]SHJ88988.1 inner membrane protein [Pseudozobellia thermophila]
MDSLTQIVLGAAVGEAVLGKKVGNKAMLYGAIAGTIPDLDVLANYFFDTVTATELHRGFTHSIFFSVVFAPLFGALVSKIESRGPAGFKDWSWLMFWGMVTHPVLDAFTTWGTRLFWPFDLRLAFQSIFVIDPLYTLPFLVFLILAMREDRTSPKRRKWNGLGLVVSTSYLVLTLILKGVAYYKFDQALEAQNIPYVKMDTRPSPFNGVLWMANIDVGDAYLMGNYSFFDSRGISFESYPKNHQDLGDLAANGRVRRLIGITDGWYAIGRSDEGLLFNDLRFGLVSLDPGETQFAFSYLLKPRPDGDVEVVKLPRRKDDAKRLMAALWKRIWGN